MLLLDLWDLLRETYDLLKSNLILFLPPLVTAYLLPIIIGVFAILVFVPILVAATNYPNFVSSLMIGAIVGGTVMVVIAITLWIGILAGQANMNKKVVLTGKTNFADFREGFGKYFARILGGHIVLFVIYLLLTVYLLLIFTGVGLGFPMEPAPFQDIIRRFSEVNWNLVAVPLPLWLDVLKLMARFSVVILGLVIISFLVYLFTLTWIQACVIEEVGALKAIRMSCGFVARNFYSAIGYLGLYVIAASFAGRIFPGILLLPFSSLTSGGGYGLGIPGIFDAALSLIITTFFTLLLYVFYADRAGKRITAKPPSPPPVVFRAFKKE